MDYPCGKFGDCSFSRFGFIVQAIRHTDADSHDYRSWVIIIIIIIINTIIIISHTAYDFIINDKTQKTLW